MNLKLIGISGKMKSGKDYIGSIFKEHLCQNQETCVILSFADQLKFDCIVADYIKLSQNSPQNISDISKLFQKYFEHKPSEIRQNIQNYGMDKRFTVDNNYWIYHLYLQILLHSFRGVYTFIITDVRFENEYNFIKALGGTIVKVVAPNRCKELTFNLNQSQINHESELFIDIMKYDFSIDNDNNDNLTTDAINICYNIIHPAN